MRFPSLVSRCHRLLTVFIFDGRRSDGYGCSGGGKTVKLMDLSQSERSLGGDETQEFKMLFSFIFIWPQKYHLIFIAKHIHHGRQP
uniref:Uncharacterized protein n=1 Tax=Knipowitschia caucasica TaxID=637954 RepID=A0AAV2KQY3_KNICA